MADLTDLDAELDTHPEYGGEHTAAYALSRRPYPWNQDEDAETYAMTCQCGWTGVYTNKVRAVYDMEQHMADPKAGAFMTTNDLGKYSLPAHRDPFPDRSDR